MCCQLFARKGADHEPVQADKAQALCLHHGTIFVALTGRDCRRIFRQSEWRDLDSLITRLANAAARVGKRKLLKSFVTNRVMEPVAHVKTI